MTDMTEKENAIKFTVHEAILAVADKIGTLEKLGWNKHQNYKFVGIDQITAAIQPLLSEYGVTIVPSVLEHKSENRPSADGKIQRFCTVLVQYTVTGPNGDSFVSVMVGEAADTLDKSMNKAVAAAAKYFLKQTFWIATGDEDPDEFGDEQTNNGGGQRQPSGRPTANRGGNALKEKVKGAANRRSSEGGNDPNRLATDGMVRKIWAICHQSLGWDDIEMYSYVDEFTSERVDKLDNLLFTEAKQIIDALEILQQEQGN